MTPHPLTFGELREANISRCEQVFHPVADWSATDWATAMAGECGEVCNLIKKLRRGDSIDVRDIAHELADLIIYADFLANRLGIDLGAAVIEKFNLKSEQFKSTVSLPATTDLGQILDATLAALAEERQSAIRNPQSAIE
jgi:NTP pyrophosphatase (non-canonical NTP hydrolase)